MSSAIDNSHVPIFLKSEGFALVVFSGNKDPVQPSAAGTCPLWALVRPRSTHLAVFPRFHRDPFSKQTLSGNVIHFQTDAVGILEQH